MADKVAVRGRCWSHSRTNLPPPKLPVLIKKQIIFSSMLLLLLFLMQMWFLDTQLHLASLPWVCCYYLDGALKLMESGV